MQGQLLTEDFLAHGIAETARYRALTADQLAAFARAVSDRLAPFEHAGSPPGESVTEDDLIYPILELLGWPARLVQQPAARRRTEVPDALLLADAAAKAAALAEPSPDRRYRHGTTFVEAKRWRRTLDRGEETDRLDPEVPSNQMLRYLSQVAVASDDRMLWGILTNGSHWRLYYQRSTSRAEEFVEIELARVVAALTGAPDGTADRNQAAHDLRCFILLFGPTSFLADPELDGRTFLDFCREQARLWEARVAEDLSRVVFGEVFPRLLRGFATRDRRRPLPLDEPYLAELRRAALTFLYRLLFLLHAEDRGLLPVDDRRYADYSLRALRRKVAERHDRAEAGSATQARDYAGLAALFRAVANGDDAIGLPPYNGGLFSDDRHPALAVLELSDADLGFVLDALSRREVAGERRWINYRDLSVQQLGSVYERLLEYRAVSPDGYTIEIAQGPYSRRVSGSYYTPESLVQLAIERAVGPLVEERRQEFATALAEERADRGPMAKRLERLMSRDPAARVLELRVLDPAMGSGHFLVSLVDYLTDRALELLSWATETVAASRWNGEYSSPLLARVAAIRARILEEAQRHGWPVNSEQLDDRHLVRRIVLKRVVYGVDLEPMAVELAKLSLWLHSFTVGAPLSFLDHHLRCGNSLIGARVEEVRERLERSHLFGSAYAGMLGATEMMHTLETATDVDIGEVRESARIFSDIEATLEPYRRLVSLDTAHEWLLPESAAARRSWLTPRDVLGGLHGEPLRLLADPTLVQHGGVRWELERALVAARDEAFFPWELEFPEVWYEQQRAREDPGFDAVLGNPPWDRIKLQEVEFFAERRPEVATAQTAAERRRRVRALEKAGDPLWRDYSQAAERAERLAGYARRCGHYPQLSGGDVNLYALFVERAVALLRRRGIAALIVPSGIAGDKEKAGFFGDLATAGRIGAVLDFENKRSFFSDIHASFKFCVFAFGGPDRRFPAADCAFFLQSTEELTRGERVFALTPEDFARVNPNTRTAPVFRTRRDAEIVRGIYEHLPVLVDRRCDPPTNQWNIRYFTMFHMTNDSALFRTVEQLEREGWYRVAGNRFRKGSEHYVPLYEGKMVQAYDHRAASVIVHADNVHRPGQPEPATEEQHSDPAWSPAPQFWVAEGAAYEAVAAAGLLANRDWFLTFKDVTAPTNIRTMIAAVVPKCGLGNTLPAFATPDPRNSALLLATLNSLAFDYVARQKVQGQHLNLYIVEQLALPAPATFEERVGGPRGQTLADYVCDAVLRLTYTAHDLAGFARDLGYEGPPFAWNEEERRHLRARLDAVFFQLYGLTQDEAAYILSTFPLLERQDREEVGRYRTRELVLGYLRALAAGDLASRITA